MADVLTGPDLIASHRRLVELAKFAQSLDDMSALITGALAIQESASSRGIVLQTKGFPVASHSRREL